MECIRGGCAARPSGRAAFCYHRPREGPLTWRTKARVQDLVAALPEPIGNFCYYRLQRWFGGLRAPSPQSRVEAGFRLAAAIRAFRPLAGASIMEIGTGRSLNVPIVMWLLGACRVLTADLNRYLRPELVRSDIDYYRSHRQWLIETLAEHDSGYGSIQQRLDRLLAVDGSTPIEFLDRLLELCGITYMAPVDAAALDLSDQPLDVHLSNFVFEHIPEDSLHRILESALNQLSPDGLCVHLIDLSDHFQHSDATIPRLNFLRFSNDEWIKYAGNRFMYMNRLRASEYLSRFATCGLTVRHEETLVDDSCLDLIERGELPLAERLRNSTTIDLAVTNQLLVASPTADSREFVGRTAPP